MKKVLAASLVMTLTSVLSFAIEKKPSSTQVSPATHSEFTECFGLLDHKMSVSAFDPNNNYTELKTGSRVTVPLKQGGDIIVQVSNVTTGKVAPRTPAAASGWDDQITAVTVVEGTVVIAGSTGNPIKLTCERHNRSRY